MVKNVINAYYKESLEIISLDSKYRDDELSFSSCINSIVNFYNRIKEVKSKHQIDMFDFLTTYKGDGYSIINGKLEGDSLKAMKDSIDLLEPLKDKELITKEDFYNFELGSVLEILTDGIKPEPAIVQGFNMDELYEIY